MKELLKAVKLSLEAEIKSLEIDLIDISNTTNIGIDKVQLSKTIIHEIADNEKSIQVINNKLNSIVSKQQING